ncbi:uncharacterized protein LOC143516377 [Brachyhypopomus gauderio]|uniref:uncharacterized protein LOC143516377 n=1 Tax=Brachyhypopomus gauderio TaxID=698409 RepID=UPI004041CD65
MNAKMNTKHVWICLFLVFYSVQRQCAACKWIKSGQYEMKNEESLSQLKEMGGELSRSYKPFPFTLYGTITMAQAEDQVRFLAEVTVQIAELFHADLDAVNWDNRAVDNFLNILNTRQLKELKSCAATYPQTKQQRSIKTTLRKHFRKLKKILKKANYSADSWEQIRGLVRSHLVRMDIIASNLRRLLDTATCFHKKYSVKNGESMNAKMNTKHVWICLFLVFYSVQRQCAACKWIKSRQYEMKNEESLSQLKKMGGELSRSYKPFPFTLYGTITMAQAEDQVRFLAEVTVHITELFNADLDAVNWDNRAVDNFLNILNTRQLKELKSCAATYPQTKQQRSIKTTLRKHFRKLKKILKKANYSADSWEQIRGLVRSHLVRMDIIASNLRRLLAH